MTTTTATDDGSAGLVREAVGALAASLTGPGAPRGRDEWLALVGECQGLLNAVTAVQERAVAEVARRESAWEEDGALGEVLHAPGRVAIDAADLVAPALGCSHAQAERRVLQAVRVAAGRIPVEMGGRGTPEPTGLGGLAAAMTEGRLDGYRAGVVAQELEEAPAAVAEAVVAALEPHLGADDGPTLRRRCRRVLARVSPDLLRQRAARARASTGLRRWASEPGVDSWYGTFPTEDAAQAWAAIDALAHEYVRDGRCTSIEQARGKALTDLVARSSTVDVQVVLAVPAGSPAAPAGVPAGAAGDLLQVQGARPAEPVFVPRGWLAEHAGTDAATVACDPATGARLDADDAHASVAYRPSGMLSRLVRARDGRCRFPGCTVAARFCDLDHVRPWPAGPTSAANLLTLCRRHHRTKQAAGWRVRLDAGGTATWTDPSGRVRTTSPLDALETLVLTAADREPGPAPSEPTPWSPLESRMQLLAEHEEERERFWSRHQPCTSATQLRRACRARMDHLTRHDPPPF